MEKEKKLYSEYDTVIILTGNEIEDYISVRDFFSRYDHTILGIGDGENGFSYEEIANPSQENFEKKDFGKTLVVVNAHGAVDEDNNGVIQINSESVLTLSELSNDILDLVGGKTDLLSISCYSGALFNSINPNDYFNKIMTTSSDKKLSISTDFNIASNAMLGSEETMTFDNVANYFLENNSAKTDPIIWHNGGFKFESDDPSIYYEKSEGFYEYLQNSPIKEVCTETGDGCTPKIIQNYNYFTGKDSNMITLDTIPSLLEKDFYFDIASYNLGTLSSLMSPYCTNIRINPQFFEVDEEENDTLDDIIESNLDLNGLVQSFLSVGGIKCDETHFQRNPALEYASLAYQYAKYEFYHTETSSEITGDLGMHTSEL